MTEQNLGMIIGPNILHKEVREEGKEEREGGRSGEREGGKEEEWREGGREKVSEGGREKVSEGGREGGRSEEGKEG